jgi:hypothetical protein
MLIRERVAIAPPPDCPGRIIGLLESSRKECRLGTLRLEDE